MRLFIWCKYIIFFTKLTLFFLWINKLYFLCYSYLLCKKSFITNDLIVTVFNYLFHQFQSQIFLTLIQRRRKCMGLGGICPYTILESSLREKGKRGWKRENLNFCPLSNKKLAPPLPKLNKSCARLWWCFSQPLYEDIV